MSPLPPFSALWTAAWQRYAAQHQMMLTIGALAGAPLVAISFIPLNQTLPHIATMVGVYVLAGIWVSFATMTIYASVVHSDIKMINDVFRLGFTRWVPFLTTQLLQTLLVFGLFLIVLVSLGFVAWTPIQHVIQGTPEVNDVKVLLLLGGIAAVGTFILSIFSYRFIFSGFIVFSEQKYNIAALRSSFALTQNRVISVWGKFFIFGLVSAAISICLSIVNGVATGSLAEGSIALQVINALFGLFEYMVMIPLTTLFTATIYQALRQPPATLQA